MSKKLFTTRKTPSQVRAREEPPESKLPTGAQMATLKAFALLCDKLGKAPSIREVSDALGMKAEQGAQRHLIALVQKGCLEEIKELVVKERKLTPLGKKWLGMAG